MHPPLHTTNVFTFSKVNSEFKQAR